MATRNVWEQVYALFEDATPLTVDCGRLCGSRCCQEWEPEVGMYLLPGEECMFAGNEDWLTYHSHAVEDYDFCPSWSSTIKTVTFATCEGRCPRSARPFACRTFPLAPHIAVSLGSGTAETIKEETSEQAEEIEMVFDETGLLVCPLVQLGKLDVLNQRFVSSCIDAWKLLISSDALIADEVRYRSMQRIQMRSCDANRNLSKLLGIRLGKDSG